MRCNTKSGVMTMIRPAFHKWLMITLLSIFAAHSLAQTSEENAQALAGAMAALDKFMLGFNRRDAQAWAASLNYPHVRFASGNVTIWNSAEEFASRASFANLVNNGWDHSHWISREVSLLSPEKVHFNTVFQRFNANNEVIGTYESLYIVTKVNGHWGTQARSSLAP
jgi:hypothetical protein